MLHPKFHYLWTAGLVLAFSSAVTAADTYNLHRFDRQQLTDVYYSEGVNVGDVNRDGKLDIVHGPYWFAGPDFKTSHEIYPPQAQPRERYADNFFSWVHDFNGDGWGDVLVVGFPGTPAYVYENPTESSLKNHWKKHQVLDQVSNESPQFIDLVGDARPELVCTHNGRWGYATINEARPFESWTFHAISQRPAPKPFGHGLGVGDVDGDGRGDILTKDGWFQQPTSGAASAEWQFHPVAFSAAGGADMFAYDVDGDGDNDVITSLQAHEYGLAWFEQLREGDQRVFRQHSIMGRTPSENRYGLVFTEPHSVNLVDMDGDGLKDIVTGKTYWSHHTKSPMWDAGAVVYWFKLVRGKDGIDWVPHLADGESGIGRQIIVADVNQDQLPDLVAGGMKGCHVMLHRRDAVDEETWRAAQPKPRRDMAQGLTPQEAAAHMTVPAGFRVQLAAGEPQIHQPVAFTLDARGRVWVAEAYTYPTRAPDGEGKDKIVILSDTDGDGSLDRRQVFIEGLNLVSGLEVGFGGVWVGAAPYLLFIPDRNSDDIPDRDPEVLLDGFGFQDTHETLNSFIWGPDGWLYGCHGVFTRSLVGKPGTAQDARTPMNAAIWRYHPTRHTFEIFGEGTSNPWGVDFNDYGQAFTTACVIPHLFHVIQGARYQRQAGQHFEPYVFDDIKTIADHVHYAGNIRDHAWWGHEPAELAPDTSAAGGGHAHCGAMIYLGDNWPRQHRNHIFFNNIHGNRVNNDLLERQGSGFVGHHGRDLVMANDHWFRGINLKYGPDGTVFLIDWYDKNACHRVNPLIWDRTNGRIYRISYGQAPQVAANLDQASDQQLVEYQSHANDWFVRTARRILHERAASGVDRASHIARLLQQQWRTATTVPQKLRVAWAMHGVSGVPAELLAEMSASSGPDSEYLRAWGIQLELEDRRVSDATLHRWEKMAADDSSPVVRLYLASALQRLELNRRWPLAEALTAHAEDAEDHNLPLMYWYGILPLVPANPDRAMELAAASKIPLISSFIVRRAAAENQTLDRVVAALGAADAPATRQMFLGEMLRAFEGRVDIPMPPSWDKVYDKLMASPEAEILDQAEQVAVLLGDRRIFPRLRKVLVDAEAPAAQRQRALDILVRGRDPQGVSAFLAVVDDPQLRSGAIRALAAYDDARVPTTLLKVYGGLPEAERRDAMSTLTSRPANAMALLDAIQQGKVPRTDLHAFHVRQLTGFDREDLNARIKQVWGEIRASSEDKQKEIDRLRGLLRPAALARADLGNGRRLFAKTCATCHVLFGDGAKVGPDITGSNRANLDYLLENIVDPSAVLGKDYRMIVLSCADGRVVSGLVQKETDSALTVRTINDTVVVPKSDIDEQRLSDQSLMPERLLDSLTPNEVRDLVAYLGSPTQVALSGPKSVLDPATKRVADSLEGESLEVLAKTHGNAAPQGMDAFTKDVWSGSSHLWWTGAKPGAKLELAIPVAADGKYQLELVLTKARDYGIVQLSLDGQPLGGPIDLFNSPDVITTGVLDFTGLDLKAGQHKLGVAIVGAHPEAVKAYMFGLDYIRLRSQP